MLELFNKHIDKVAHFSVSYFLLTYLSLFLPTIYSVLLAFIIGILKEFIDKKFDYKDIISNCLGILIGITFLSMQLYR